LLWFTAYRCDPTAWRKYRPDASGGGTGLIDHEVLPLCDALCELDGVCTIQSCCGHVNSYGYAYPGQLWIRLGRAMALAAEARIGELLRHDVIAHVQKLMSLRGGSQPHEVLDVQFEGEPDGRMREAEGVILGFFRDLALR
jgi:hypothetical protein